MAHLQSDKGVTVNIDKAVDTIKINGRFGPLPVHKMEGETVNIDKAVNTIKINGLFGPLPVQKIK